MRDDAFPLHLKNRTYFDRAVLEDGEFRLNAVTKQSAKQCVCASEMTRVCVTGASGFIASWLVKFLLERGYTVSACVRSPDNLAKTAHLMNLPHAKENLHLFKADLQDEGSFDSAIEDCEGIFHTASPFFFNITDPQKELIEPAVSGTLNVLRACAKAKSLKRVVLTSSVAAVSYNPSRKPDDIVDESFFSDPDYCRKGNMWYQLSKTLAENEAWKFCEEHGIDMVAINPAMVVGALLQPTMNTSSEAILKLLNGAPTYSNASLGWVHVKDVAEAHVRAYEVPSASGRYLCVQRVAHYEEIAEILRKMYPEYPIPTKCADASGPRMPVYQVNTRKLENDLSLKLLPIEEAIRDCADCLISQNFVKAKM